ncbi:GNAT family N-acetyltransferase [Actinoplanes regularis]|uniref:Protein N-acetyltransferase, RimJ/RimL family n=1 Tax=Actinoplanes regularis TaxID=52697 RepID=A0A238X6E0_9ACTN|nr:GNAT family N-acetyltransferase [Actinoplanes regularis]GIE86472.1 GNAT family acetyltransferase [Actinoplanes regularis]SNR54202.1 Protein N-acetyltransferase, RimJ/RimL family [Actinoplanes regularis]
MLNWAELRTERLWLDRPRIDDLAQLHAVHADPRTNMHNPAGPTTDMVRSRTMVEEWLTHWDQNGFGYWVVREDPPGEVIGAGGLRRHDVDGVSSLNLYYRFAVAAWGRGYAAELATKAVELAARDLPGVPVVAIVHPDNIASWKVAVRAGLRPAGHTQHHGGTRLLLSTPAHQKAFGFDTASTVNEVLPSSRTP